MAGTVKVRFRLEYKGQNEDIETPHPLSVEVSEGSNIMELLRNAARFHQE